MVLAVWAFVALLHWQPWSRGLFLALTAIFTLYSGRLLWPQPPTSETRDLDNHSPFTISLLIPARNEATVLDRIVTSLFQSNYPAAQLEVWVIDDGSNDEPPQHLQDLTNQFPQLKVLHRPTSSGGKSGALNAVLPQTTGEIIGVFDADAYLEPDAIHHALRPFHQPQVGAVQLRKTLLNAAGNGLTKGQQWEQSFDAALQSQRQAAGGWVELRGNGTFIRRQSLMQCGGWQEDTLTDDLDLDFRLYLSGIEVVFLTNTWVYEEGVTQGLQFWRQRCRWAEGGCQRYLDYFGQLWGVRGWAAIDLWMFFVLQFLLPVGLVADVVCALAMGHLPVLWPLQTLLGLLVMVEMMRGLTKFEALRGLALFQGVVGGLLFMLHWPLVMLVIILKCCILRQSLVWHPVEHGQGRGGQIMTSKTSAGTTSTSNADSSNVGA